MTTLAHFLERVDKDGPGGCWLWTGSLLASGYGQTRHDGSQAVHRISYEFHVGPIPDGLVIDHLCSVKHCVNPAHLEAVTQKENVRRAQARKTHCPHGHPYSGANLYVNPTSGHRLCRACGNIGARRRTRERRQVREQILRELVA